MSGLFNELKRRNVFRVGIAYAVVAWLILQIVDTVAPGLGWPTWVMSFFIVLVAVGFPIALLFSWAFEMTPDGVKKSKDVDREASVTSETGQKINYMIGGALVLALGFIAWDKLAPGPDTVVQEADSGDEVIATASTASIAVLPFVNMSSDPEQEYFSDGLAEEILNVLVRVPGLSVASRTSAFAYKGENRNITLIASELGVDHILEGSVRTVGNRVRITAQLINAETDRHLWSEVYDRELDDVFAIQDEIATAIGLALQVQLTDARGNALSVAGTSNTAAHNAYLQGRYLLHQRGFDKVARAVVLFEEAITLDPEFAGAYASLAFSKTIGWNQLDPAGAAMASARALELNPALPEALSAGGLAAMRQFRWKEAEGAMREAISLEPGTAIYSHFLGGILSMLGRYEEAAAMAKRAVAIDPTSTIMRIRLGIYLMSLGQEEEGMGHLDAAMTISRAGYFYAVNWKALTGDTEGALALFDAATVEFDLAEDRVAQESAFILVAAGRVEEARALLSSWVVDDEFLIETTAIAMAYLGRIDDANRAMEMLIKRGDGLDLIHAYLRFMPGHPMGETRYNEFRASVGLPGLADE